MLREQIKILVQRLAEDGDRREGWMPTRHFAQLILFTLFMGVVALAACTPITRMETTPVVAAPTAAPDPAVVEALQRVETVLDRANQFGSFNGAALIAQNGEILWSKAWGLADRQANIPNTPQTPFRVGELGMQFTAAAMLLLEQEGKLSMQDPICDYLDDCPETWQGITIHHLLSHTSGIPEYLMSLRPGVRELEEKGGTPQQIVAMFRDRPLDHEPGARRTWGHSAFVLAGLIIERVSGQTYDDFVRQHIFAPLGMVQSGCGDPVEGLAPGYASSDATTPVTYDVSALYGSGACYSTAEDLFRWNEGLYNGRLLNDAQLQKMLTPHATIDGFYNSGYGIVVAKLLGRNAAGNGGGPDGYDAVIDRFLDEKATLLLVGNQNMDIFSLSDRMEAAFFGAD